MIIRLLALLLIFSSFTSPVNDSLIPWKKDRKLTWTDFKGAPDKNSSNAALTSSGISFNWTSENGKFTYSITCTFDKTKSWGRVKNDHILAHEQRHFDITEIHARKLNKALSAYKYNEKTANKDVNNIYTKVIQELYNMQTQYDRETDHSRNATKQKEWEAQIDKELNALDGYAGYELE